MSLFHQLCLHCLYSIYLIGFVYIYRIHWIFLKNSCATCLFHAFHLEKTRSGPVSKKHLWHPHHFTPKSDPKHHIGRHDGFGQNRRPTVAFSAGFFNPRRNSAITGQTVKKEKGRRLTTFEVVKFPRHDFLVRVSSSKKVGIRVLCSLGVVCALYSLRLTGLPNCQKIAAIFL